MKPRLPASLLAIFPLFLFLNGLPGRSLGAGIAGQGVREPALAGAWYPGHPEKLRGQITEFLSKADGDSVQGEMIALLVPHAGHMYSGQVAAFGYKHLRGTDFKRVILIGPSHYVGFKGIAVDLQSGYRTPLGTAPLDKDFADELLRADRQIRCLPDAFAREHSLEIQVPFLQSVLKDFSIVPLLMREYDEVTCTALAEGLAKTIKKTRGRTLVLASTDLSHFHNSEEAKLLDHRFIDGLRAFDPRALLQSMTRGECEACGGGPAVATMMAARDLGARQAVVFRYANSGDVTGDYKRVVGYVSAAFVGR